ncbi:xylanolytic transcriptional activator xlnr [Fusarium albosuccineum]|uniref:Xylanolytic transcriptional activator xlnr n=1 Tax=Fusarium albosuccineum TaxID=1237068 RepID=A0A8H4L3U1_9HYPO|nr:xylanolytic transcriptional activator xlnr [Fusarium albosuccineum]
MTIEFATKRKQTACDECNKRKARCSQPRPCSNCRSAGRACIVSSKRAKRKRKPRNTSNDENQTRKDRLATATSLSPQTSVGASANMPSEQAVDAESIAPMSVLKLLVDDFFTYVYPLAPFPHESTFRQSLANREDRTRPDFLGLLASMICTLVAFFPRSVRERFETQQSVHLFRSTGCMFCKCYDIAMLRRESNWQLRKSKTIDDAATSYFLGLTLSCSNRESTSHYFMSEARAVLKELGFHQLKCLDDMPILGDDDCPPDPTPFNRIEDQIWNRIFHCIHLKERLDLQHGASSANIVIAPSRVCLPHHAHPEHAGDDRVAADTTPNNQDGSTTSLMGFWFMIEVCTTIDDVVSRVLAPGTDTFSWAGRCALLPDVLLRVKIKVAKLPPELRFGYIGGKGFSSAGFGGVATQDDATPALSTGQSTHGPSDVAENDSNQRQYLQYEIQKINIFISMLVERSDIVKLYFDLENYHLFVELAEGHSKEGRPVQDTGKKPDYKIMNVEKEFILHDLSRLLESISRQSVEPNGRLLVAKIRRVVSILRRYPPEYHVLLEGWPEQGLLQLEKILRNLESASSINAAVLGHTDPNQMVSQVGEQEPSGWEELCTFRLQSMISRKAAEKLSQEFGYDVLQEA